MEDNKALHSVLQTEDASETKTDNTVPQQDEALATPPSAGRERLYSHFNKVPLKRLDAFIAVCVVALVIVLILGYLNSHGGF